MSDARLSSSFPTHPKTKKLLRRLGPAGPWALVCLFLWARMNRPDGDLSGMTAEDVELACDWSGDEGALVAALLSVGFLDGEEGSHSIHDWAEHQPWSAGASRRSAVARENASKKWGSDLASQNRTKRSERLAEGRKRGTHTPVEWGALVKALGGRCLACGSLDDICKDHVHPLYLGGSDAIDNLQPLCRSCNSKKCGPGNEIDYRPEDWAKLLRDELTACGVLASALPNACRTPAERLQSGSETPAPSPYPSPSPKKELPSSTGEKHAEQPADPIFGTGLALLVRKGVPEKSARSFLGMLRKSCGDDLAAAALLVRAEADDVSDPVAWLTKAAKATKAGPQLSLVPTAPEPRRPSDKPLTL